MSPAFPFPLVLEYCGGNATCHHVNGPILVLPAGSTPLTCSWSLQRGWGEAFPAPCVLSNDHC